MLAIRIHSVYLRLRLLLLLLQPFWWGPALSDAV